ncbi:hypothetical protein [Streptomyces sp. AM 2-1-1]|uniref:hypothetical protein n=1 Tax=Streptomyces sp. AM 2-1-1 TaxID=3028709 RepID=UPI0023B8FDA0|nr:hypothetical protein [Streptomyces sp. AM 2-1-1]WEH38086.1 hypothetical protein PZB77_00355 [Streptomyces sp. AM 2-1-1]
MRRSDETLIPVPDPQAALESNYCDVTVLHDADGGRIVVLAALDNLVEGAAMSKRCRRSTCATGSRRGRS